jgi:O-antigen/teichoic acid export membrane protein
MSRDIAKSVAKGVSLGMAQQLVTWTSTFVLMLFLPRYLGSVEYGRLYLAMSIGGIFMIFVDYDGRYSVAKMVARAQERTPELIANCVGFRLVFWALSFLTLTAFAFLAGYPQAVKILIIIFGIEMLWQAGLTVLWGSFQGHGLFQYGVVGAIVERGFVAVAGVTALLLGGRALVMSLIMVTGALLNFLWLAKSAPRILPYLPKIDWKATKKIIKDGVPYFLSTIFGIIYYRINSVMLSFMAPEAVLGWFGAAYRFLDTLLFLPAILGAVVLPLQSRAWQAERKTHSQMTQRSLEYIIVASVPIFISVFAFAENIIKIFYGLSEFAPTVIVLKVLSVGLLFLYVDMVLGPTLLSADRQRQGSIVGFCTIPLSVGLNWFLIPYAQSHYGNGGIGASAATVITEVCVMIALINLMPKGVLTGLRYAVPLKSILSGFLMGASLWFMHAERVPFIIAALIGVGVYAGSLLLMKTFDASELEFVRGLLNIHNLKNFRKNLVAGKSTTV